MTEQENAWPVPAPEDVTLEKQIGAVRREIGYRERVYPRLVAQSKMRKEQADYQINCMRAVLLTLQRLMDKRLEE